MTTLTPLTTARSLRVRALRATATALCLTAPLGVLAACSDDGAPTSEESASATGSGERGSLAAASERPSLAAAEPSATTEVTSASGGLGARPTDAPAAVPTAEWTAPEVRFYNENWAYWYQDDSLTNQDSITSQGNLEGYRTYTGRCVGIATRDINEATRFGGRSDEELSSLRLDASAEMQTFTETARERVSLVRDDGGLMEGYNITYTGTYEWADGPTEVHGYRFSRAVSEAGLTFVVMLMCEAGDEMTLDQWHEVLGGMRLTGVSGGTMGE